MTLRNKNELFNTCCVFSFAWVSSLNFSRLIFAAKFCCMVFVSLKPASLASLKKKQNPMLVTGQFVRIWLHWIQNECRSATNQFFCLFICIVHSYLMRTNWFFFLIKCETVVAVSNYHEKLLLLLLLIFDSVFFTVHGFLLWHRASPVCCATLFSPLEIFICAFLRTEREIEIWHTFHLYTFFWTPFDLHVCLLTMFESSSLKKK